MIGKAKTPPNRSMVSPSKVAWRKRQAGGLTAQNSVLNCSATGLLLQVPGLSEFPRRLGVRPTSEKGNTEDFGHYTRLVSPRFLGLAVRSEVEPELLFSIWVWRLGQTPMEYLPNRVARWIAGAASA